VAYTALVVDADPEAVSATNRALSSAGYIVAPALTFAEARLLLATARPDALIASVRLAGFNGLHLAAVGRAALPDLVTVVTHAGPDRALQAAAAAQGAFYFSTPVDPRLLADIIGQVLDARGPRATRRVARRWRRKRVVNRVDAVLGAGAGLVVDISYGGAQLQLRKPVKTSPLPTDPLVIAPNLSMRARRVWTRAAGADGPWWYGIELHPADLTTQRAWEAFVDRVN